MADAERWIKPYGTLKKRLYIDQICAAHDGKAARGTAYGQVRSSQASSTIAIHAPADAVWRVISDFGAACQYLDMVVNCTVEGEGVGALRTLTFADGGTLVERLEALDEVARRLSYTLLSDTPLSDTPFRECLTTVTVHYLGPSQAEVAWSATFEPDVLPPDEAVELLERAFELNGQALRNFMAASAP